MRAVLFIRFSLLTAFIVLCGFSAQAGTISITDLKRENITPFLSPLAQSNINIDTLNKAAQDAEFNGRKNVLRLGQTNPGGWYTINIENNTNETRFVFEFGGTPLERDGVLNSIGVINLTEKKTLINGMEQNKAVIADPIVINLPKGEMTSVALYFESKPPYHFFSKLYLQPLSKATSGHAPINIALIAALCAVAFAVFAVGIAYHPLTGLVTAIGIMFPLMYVFSNPCHYWIGKMFTRAMG